ncbi:hypothetical protein VNI00_006938 [Paramarasmius palmivorus]|uniref:Uncharacterized protein n=1 Tax=Paramarasmius palmivorus TaxID=297713 RepID=A0AAW0D2T4_9AGAR
MFPDNEPRDLWLQRFRLDGMVLAAFVYGIYFLLSIQASIVVRRSRRSSRLGKWKARLLYLYIIATLLLSTLGFACNARYTEDIWINMAHKGTPEDLIEYELDFWWNRVAMASDFVMIWVMYLLLLYRCFVIWNYYVGVVVGLVVVYLGVIGLSIAVMHCAQLKAVFINIKAEVAFLALSCIFNLLYTILISIRLLTVRKRVIDALGSAHAKSYTSLMAILVESAALYFVFGVVFVFAFGFKSKVQNLVFLEHSNIQVGLFEFGAQESNAHDAR